MNILMISPPMGGIDIYVKRLRAALEELGIQVAIDGARENETAFDSKKKAWKSSQEVKKIVEGMAKRIKFDKYDLVAFYYGKNDIEQYLPVVLGKKEGKRVPNSVYFVHYLSRNLFSEYLNDPLARKEIEKQVGNFYSGYVFFGQYAKEFMENQYQKKFNGIINFLPETHAHEILNKGDLKKLEKRFIHPSVVKHKLPFIAWPGFPTHYKDYSMLIEALRILKTPLALLFAGYGWRKYLGFTEKKIGKCFVYCVDKYLSSKEYFFLAKKSLFGVFPYRQPNNPEERFQGSGTLPNFIYEGKATIVLDEGAMPEYVGDAGIVLKDRSFRKLAGAIEEMLDSEVRGKYENAALRRKPLFSIHNHAKICLSFFHKLLAIPH